MNAILEISKCNRCKFIDYPFVNHKIQVVCKKENPDFPLPEDGKCVDFNSKYIEYPIEVMGIENTTGEENRSLYGCGQLVVVRPCGKEYEDKQYLGILLGDMQNSAWVTYNPEDKILNIFADTNPAIFVPELKKIIWGCESWWRKIEKPDDFAEITDEQIKNVWYVRYLMGESALETEACK